MKLLSPDILEPELLTMDFVQPDIVSCGELSQSKIKPYIKGHVTDGSSSFTFKINNANVTVPVDANGNWKWVVDRTITRLYEAFYKKNVLDFVKFYNIDLSSIISAGAFNSAFRQIDTLVVDMRHCKGEINVLLDYTFLSTEVTWYMPNLGTNTEFEGAFSKNNSSIIPFGYIKCSCNFSALQILTEQSVVNIFNAVAADNIILTFHSTVYAMVQAQMDAEEGDIYDAYMNSDYDFDYASA